ncbi:MAG: hypothetical protein WC554_02000 [Clostridia bacterium]
MTELDEFDITKTIDENETEKQNEEKGNEKEKEDDDEDNERQQEMNTKMMSKEQLEEREQLLKNIDLFQNCEFNQDKIIKYQQEFNKINMMSNEELKELLKNLISSIDNFNSLTLINESVTSIGYGFLEEILLKGKLQVKNLGNILKNDPKISPKMNRLIEAMLLKYNLCSKSSIEMEILGTILNTVFMLDSINRKNTNQQQHNNNNNNQQQNNDIIKQ